MRFFTKAWHNGGLTDAAFDAAPEAYRLDLAALRLPTDVTALSQADLHDGRILDVSADPTVARLALRLRCGDLQRGYADIRIEYSGGTVDDASLAVLDQAREVPRDEILYDEVDRVCDHFEHRLILASYKEAFVSFRSVALVAQPVGCSGQRADNRLGQLPNGSV